MTPAKWANRYGGIFLADQTIGVFTGITGFWVPNIYLYWLHSFEASIWGLITILASVVWLSIAIKQKREWMYYVLPAYHIAGLVLMPLRVNTVADRLSSYGWFLMVPSPKSAANFAALQDFDVTWLSLAHSSIGVVVGVAMLLLMKQMRNHEDTKIHEAHETTQDERSEPRASVPANSSSRRDFREPLKRSRRPPREGQLWPEPKQ
jgi:hypothetical protein